MNRNEALQLVKEQITEKRYVHTLGVAETAVKLAKRYGADVKKAELAAIFHDYAKFRIKEGNEANYYRAEHGKGFIGFSL